MAHCPECGRPVKNVKLPDGGEIMLDNSQSMKGPDRYYIDYEQGPVPVGVKMSDARPFLGYPDHAGVCVKAEQPR